MHVHCSLEALRKGSEDARKKEEEEEKGHRQSDVSVDSHSADAAHKPAMITLPGLKLWSRFNIGVTAKTTAATNLHDATVCPARRTLNCRYANRSPPVNVGRIRTFSSIRSPQA